MGGAAVRQRFGSLEQSLASKNAAVRQRLQTLEDSLAARDSAWNPWKSKQDGVESFDVMQYKLFDYVCPKCKEKRQIQYFHSGGCFVSQMPTVCCGGCKEYIDPTTIFKTADFQCPQCSVIRRVRIPARPVPLDTYQRTISTCDQCWFRGEVKTGRHVVAVCEQCHMHASRMTDIWSENGDTLSMFCEGCKTNTQGVVLPHALMARLLRGGRELEQGAIHFQCPQCKVPQHSSFADLVASHLICVCSNGCGWRGPPPEEKKSKPGRPSSAGRGGSPSVPGTRSSSPTYSYRPTSGTTGQRQQPFYGAVPPPPNSFGGKI